MSNADTAVDTPPSSSSEEEVEKPDPVQVCLATARTPEQVYFCRVTGGKRLRGHIVKYADDPGAR